MSDRKLTSGERFVRAVKLVRAHAEAEDRQVREALTAHLKAVWAIVEEALGPEEAKELWQSTPPKKPRGSPGWSHRDEERVTGALLRDFANRNPPAEIVGWTPEGEPIRAETSGMTAEESAERLAGWHGLPDDPGDAARTLRKWWATEKGQLIKRQLGGQ